MHLTVFNCFQLFYLLSLARNLFVHFFDSSPIEACTFVSFFQAIAESAKGVADDLANLNQLNELVHLKSRSFVVQVLSKLDVLRA